jgi:hypothetical protein
MSQKRAVAEAIYGNGSDANEKSRLWKESRLNISSQPLDRDSCKQ